MAEPVTNPEWVSVMGLWIPVSLRDRLVAAGRERYPELTQDLDDNRTVQAVTKFWWVSLLAEIEAGRAEAPVDEEIVKVRQEYRQRGRAAKMKALQDAAAITDTPPAGPQLPA